MSSEHLPVDYSGSIWQDIVDDSLFMITGKSDFDPTVFMTLEQNCKILHTTLDDNIKTGRYRRIV